MILSYYEITNNRTSLDVTSLSPPPSLQVFALVDGSIDAQRYEDSCRLLLGNHAYLMFTLDKVIQQTLKCLQAMVNDDVVSTLLNPPNLTIHIDSLPWPSSSCHAFLSGFLVLIFLPC